MTSCENKRARFIVLYDVSLTFLLNDGLVNHLSINIELNLLFGWRD